ncbi:hypothetical protein [Capnocytophaga canis]|uniref:hypothetical protein n=1 Tax=Capnocytophaga canis TaxID=1848903 RepID=UPI001562D346|nr:hypothetical protein [Capnocytophaga canis]
MKNNNFEIITGDEILIQEVIEYYNDLYKTDFIINEYEDRDGVIFAKISYTNANINDVVQLGVFFGMRIQYKRDNNEIDW